MVQYAFEPISQSVDVKAVCRAHVVVDFVVHAASRGNNANVRKVPLCSYRIDDAGLYIAVSNKVELNLGRCLAIKFAAEHLPDTYDDVCRLFHRSGAYRRFKELLERHDSLEAWYEYEAKEI